MRKISTVVLISLLAGSIFIQLSCKKSSTDNPENPAPLGVNDPPLPDTNTNWMSRISDSKYLCELSIPGSHDAAADQSTSQVSSIVAPFVICQNFYILNQMNIGVRWFDIRLNDDNGVLTAHHAQYYLHKNFDDLLSAGLTFLENNPTESVIYMIKQENSNVVQDEFAQAVYNYLKKWSPDMSKFYIGHDMPNLGMIRGKITIISRYGTSQAYSNMRGMYVDWDDNTSGENVDNCDYPLWVQDHYSCVTVPYSEKIDEIKQGIIYANTAHNNRLYINFTSCEKDPDHYLTTVAANINPPICDYLDANQQYKSCGVLMVNFAGGGGENLVPYFVLAIINHNNFSGN